MENNLRQIRSMVYKPCGLVLSDFQQELESKDYAACRFKLNGVPIVSRVAKVTPKKAGQFVTCWKREKNGPIEPFEETDSFELLVVNVHADEKLGQFVFPKHILCQKGIVSAGVKEGKRAFRVYAPWDKVISKQALRSQKWQSAYFFFISESVNIDKVQELYSDTNPKTRD